MGGLERAQFALRSWPAAIIMANRNPYPSSIGDVV